MVKFFDFLALLAFCALIYWLSDQSHLPVPMMFDLQDKLHHATAYFVMGVLAWRNFRHVVGSYKLLALVSISFCGLYGISDEWHQSFVPGRSSDVLDWLADTIGASVGVILLSRLSFKKRHFNKQRAKTIQNS
jgi:VanZ family protein